jgi:hypothetical protein
MPRRDEQRNEEPKEAEDLELDDEQSEGVQGGFASAESKASVANKASSTSTASGPGTVRRPLKQI